MQVMDAARQVQGGTPLARALQGTEQAVPALVVAQRGPPVRIPRGDGLRIVGCPTAISLGPGTTMQHPLVVGWLRLHRPVVTIPVHVVLHAHIAPVIVFACRVAGAASGIPDYPLPGG